MNTYTVIHHNGKDYWLQGTGEVMVKYESHHFWTYCLETLPEFVQYKLGVSKCRRIATTYCTLKVLWS